MTEQTTADTLHSSVVRAADCRSAGSRFNSGRRSWFTYMTWSSKLTSNQIIQMINIMSPIRTTTRKSVNKGEGEEVGGRVGRRRKRRGGVEVRVEMTASSVARGGRRGSNGVACGDVVREGAEKCPVRSHCNACISLFQKNIWWQIAGLNQVPAGMNPAPFVVLPDNKCPLD